MADVAIVGAGFMGTATAYPLTDNGHAVRLVGTHLDGDIIKSCREQRYHPKLKRELPATVQPYYVEEIAQALDGVDVIVSGVNSSGVHWIGRTIGPYLQPGQLIIAVTKGLEAAANGDLLILPDVLASELPEGIRDQVKLAAIGGPCIAGELAGRRQSCVVFGSRDRDAAERLAAIFRTPYYHVWTTTDLLSLEFCAALKNAFTLDKTKKMLYHYSIPLVYTLHTPHMHSGYRFTMSDSMNKLEEYLLEMEHIDETDSRLLHQVAYERLKDALKYAGLQAGEPLSEIRISKVLGISRTPVREAIQRLAQEGLLQVIPGRAIAVAAPSMQEVLDALHVRELLEPELVRLAAKAFPDDAKKPLDETIERMEQAAQAGDRLSWSRADTAWHETLSRVCPNQLLGELVLQARNRVLGIVFEDYYYEPYLIQGTKEHRAITDAILANDGEAAESLMRDHLQEARRKMFKRY